MRQLKNIVIILVAIFYHSIAVAGIITNLPESGTISAVSDNMILSVQDRTFTIALPYIYIPQDIISTATSRLMEWTAGKAMAFHYISDKPDRYGSINASVTTIDDGKPLQEILLQNGLAVVYFLDYSAPHSATLFRYEESARRKNLGMWGNGYLKVISSSKIADDYSKYLNRFIIVEGVAGKLHVSKKNTYINFGDNWQTDFTVQLDNKTTRKLPDFSATALHNKRIRVRGWLESYNGPFMRILNPANIEVLSDAIQHK